MIRLTHFLLEDRQSKLSYLKNNMKISDDIISLISDNNVPEKYILWFGKISKMSTFKEDFFNILDSVLIFDKFKHNLPINKRDIGNIKSASELHRLVANFDTNNSTSSREELKKVKNEITLLYEDDEWKILIPHTKEASIAYGKGTKWCTAGVRNNRFNEYNKKGKLYIAINKKYHPLSVQWHFHSGQIMNIFDERIDIEYPKYTKVKEIFLKEFEKIKNEDPQETADIVYMFDIKKYLDDKKDSKIIRFFNYINNGLYAKHVTENSDGSIDYNGDVYFTTLPFVFNRVNGKFNISGADSLTSLIGTPRIINGDFDCSFNHQLKSLEDGPEIVTGTYVCNHTGITNFKGMPKEIGKLYCYGNDITSLEGFPEVVNGNVILRSRMDMVKSKYPFTEEDIRKVSNVKGQIRL